MLAAETDQPQAALRRASQAHCMGGADTGMRHNVGRLVT